MIKLTFVSSIIDKGRRKYIFTERAVLHFKTCSKITWQQCRTQHMYLGSIHTTCLTIAQLHIFFFLPHSVLWKVDTAAQTPLNNENVLSGSSSSSAKPVSCQTVNTVFQQWVGAWRNSVFVPEILMQLYLQLSSQARETVALSDPTGSYP